MINQIYKFHHTYSLWINTHHQQYFLIPDTENITSGNFLIYSILGGEKKLIFSLSFLLKSQK